MSKCDVCINKNYCVNNLDARTMCPQKDYVLFTPSYETNYERLISKTPEELAETYAGGCPNGDRLNCGKYYLHGGRDCFNCWLDWLKSPVEVDE